MLLSIIIEFGNSPGLRIVAAALLILLPISLGAWLLDNLYSWVYRRPHLRPKTSFRYFAHIAAIGYIVGLVFFTGFLFWVANKP